MMIESNYLKDPIILEELISKLIGTIYPEGDSSIDKERLENIKIYGEVIKAMVTKLRDIVIKNCDSYEMSIKEVVTEAENILSELRNY